MVEGFAKGVKYAMFAANTLIFVSRHIAFDFCKSNQFFGVDMHVIALSVLTVKVLFETLLILKFIFSFSHILQGTFFNNIKENKAKVL